MRGVTQARVQESTFESAPRWLCRASRVSPSRMETILPVKSSASASVQYRSTLTSKRALASVLYLLRLIHELRVTFLTPSPVLAAQYS